MDPMLMLHRRATLSIRLLSVSLLTDCPLLLLGLVARFLAALNHAMDFLFHLLLEQRSCTLAIGGLLGIQSLLV